MNDDLQELNLLIARQLFGFEMEYVVGAGFAGYVEVETREKMPDYCRDLVSAFLVVEFMRERWRTTDQEEFYWEFTDCQECGWVAVVKYSHHDGDIVFASASDERLEIAICKAALVFTGDIEEEPVGDDATAAR